MSSPGKDSRLLSEQDAANAGEDPSASSSRRPSSTGARPGVGDRQVSANTLAALRDQFEQYGSPPKIPNIPPRSTAGTEEATPARNTVTSPDETSSTQQKDIQRLDAVSQALAASPSRDKHHDSAVLAASGSSTPAAAAAAHSGGPATSIEEMTDAQKAMIVGLHLVDKQGQQKARRESQNQSQEAKSGIADMLKNALFKGKNSSTDGGDGKDDTHDGTVLVDESGPSTGNPADFPVSHSSIITYSFSLESLLRLANHVTFRSLLIWSVTTNNDHTFHRCHSDYKAET